jgi:hypothetical protein
VEDKKAAKVYMDDLSKQKDLLLSRMRNDKADVGGNQRYWAIASENQKEDNEVFLLMIHSKIQLISDHLSMVPISELIPPVREALLIAEFLAAKQRREEYAGGLRY